MTAFHRNCKADTRGLFINGGGGAVDLAQNKALGLANLTNSATYLTQASTLLAIRSPREIAVVANLDNNDTGILVHYGSTDGASYIYKIFLNGAGSVGFAHNSGTTLATIALPGVNGTASSYVISWSTDYDPQALSYYSEFAICRVASGAWSITRVTHAQPIAPGAGWQFNLSGYGAGSSLFSGGLTNITSVRVSSRWHSTTEAKEDWLAESSAPSFTAYQPPVELAPVSAVVFSEDPSDAVSNAILDSETMAGPAEWLAPLHAGAARQRLYSPLLNIRVNDPPTLQNTWLPTKFYQEEDTGYRYGINHLYVCILPQAPANGGLYGRVRVHVQTWVAPGAPVGTTPYLGVKMRSSTHPDGSNEVAVTSSAICTTNHGSSGVGEWLDLGEVILRGNPFSHITFLALGLTFWEGTGASYRRAKIKAINVECYSKDG